MHVREKMSSVASLSFVKFRKQCAVCALLKTMEAPVCDSLKNMEFKVRHMVSRQARLGPVALYSHHHRD